MTLEEHFSGITDPRRAQGLRTGLREVLIMVVLSNLCGHFGYRGVAMFCSVHGRILLGLLGLRHGIPSHVTFRDVHRRVDHKEVEAAFNAWASGFVPEGGWVSADGKALRSTVTMPESKEQGFESAVSLFYHLAGIYGKHSKPSGLNSPGRRRGAPLSSVVSAQVRIDAASRS